MATVPVSRTSKKKKSNSPLIVRLDASSKAALARAAELRRISVSDYVRSITVAQARRDVVAARQQILSLTAEEQVRFWNALSRAPILTPAQQRLGRVMRGEA